MPDQQEKSLRLGRRSYKAGSSRSYSLIAFHPHKTRVAPIAAATNSAIDQLPANFSKTSRWWPINDPAMPTSALVTVPRCRPAICSDIHERIHGSFDKVTKLTFPIRRTGILFAALLRWLG